MHENYELCRKRKGEDEEGGYGGPFLLTFTSRAGSEAFSTPFSASKVQVSERTSLAYSYTILLAYYGKPGSGAGPVRVRVGMADKDDLLKTFEVTLNAAQIQVES